MNSVAARRASSCPRHPVRRLQTGPCHAKISPHLGHRASICWLWGRPCPHTAHNRKPSEAPRRRAAPRPKHPVNWPSTGSCHVPCHMFGAWRLSDGHCLNLIPLPTVHSTAAAPPTTAKLPRLPLATGGLASHTRKAPPQHRARTSFSGCGHAMLPGHPGATGARTRHARSGTQDNMALKNLSYAINVPHCRCALPWRPVLCSCVRPKEPWGARRRVAHGGDN